MKSEYLLYFGLGALSLLAMSFTACGRAMAPGSNGGNALDSSETRPSPEEIENSTSQKITLPVEILGRVGVSGIINFELTEGQLSSVNRSEIYLRLADMDYDDKGYVELNGQMLVRLKNTDVTFVEPYRKAWEGFGGGYSVFKIRVPVVKSRFVVGKNQLRFVFDKFDGFSLGFRALEFNVLSDGVPVISQSQFVERSLDDLSGAGLIVSSDSAADILTGESLWKEARLVRSYQDPSSLKAKCASCHFGSGYDLKYFGFSRNSIAKRAEFHGLSAEQGRQIAAYIRSINVDSLGRPWNPPFQPGPGLSRKPTLAWLAGAGIDSVIDDENQTIVDAFPTGVPVSYPFREKGRLDLTDVRVAMELPVWKHWLPRIAPFEDEFFGDAFLQTTNYQFFADTVPNNLENWRYKNVSDYGRFRGDFVDLNTAWTNEIDLLRARFWPNGWPFEPAYRSNVRHQIQAYSLRQWKALKMLEAYHINGFDQIGLELPDLEMNLASRTPRLIENHDIFEVAPHMAKLAITYEGIPYNNGVRNGSIKTWDYFSNAWYYVQLLTTDNSRRGDNGFTHWPYTTGLAHLSSEGYDFPGFRYMNIIKALEAYTLYRPDNTSIYPSFSKWLMVTYFGRMNERIRGRTTRISNQNKLIIMNSTIRGYTEYLSQFTDAQVRSFVPDQFSGECEILGPHSDVPCESSIWYYMSKEFKDYGVDSATVSAFHARGQRLWPQFDWTLNQ